MSMVEFAQAEIDYLYGIGALKEHKKVASVSFPDDPCTAILHFDDGSTLKEYGYLAVKLKTAGKLEFPNAY